MLLWHFPWWGSKREDKWGKERFSLAIHHFNFGMFVEEGRLSYCVSWALGLSSQNGLKFFLFFFSNLFFPPFLLSFLCPFFLPSFPLSFLPSFLSFLSSFLPSFLPFFLPPSLPPSLPSSFLSFFLSFFPLTMITGLKMHHKWTFLRSFLKTFYW